MYREKIESTFMLALFPLSGIYSFTLGNHGLGLPCLSIAIFNKTCWGCGMTRSIVALWHGEIRTSLSEHPLGIVVWVLMGIISIQEFIRRHHRTAKP